LGNTDTVRRFFEAFDRRDEDALLELSDPEIRFEPASTEVAERPAYTRHDGMRRYLYDVQQTWDRFQLTVHSVQEGAQAILVLGRIYARGQGFVGDDPVGIVCRLRDGRLADVKVYTDQDAARAAAGVERPA
jgi:ketosteroid isomerase-like protein